MFLHAVILRRDEHGPLFLLVHPALHRVAIYFALSRQPAPFIRGFCVLYIVALLRRARDQAAVLQLFDRGRVQDGEGVHAVFRGLSGDVHVRPVGA